MRSFSTAINGELAKRFGTEPILIAEIEWVDGAPVAYSDQKINGADYPFPFVVSMGNFNTSTLITGSGESQNVTLTLNDIDGSLKAIINQHDVHMRPVSIYLLFAGLPVTEKVLLFSGVINSPITWDEGSRTLSLDVFSKLEDREVAFTMEDGDFPYIPPEDRNKVWPLVFGDVCNMETVSLTALRKGFLGTGQGVMDPTIEERLCQAGKLQCPTRTVAMTTTPDPDVINPDPDNVINPGSLAIEESRNLRVEKQDQQCLTRRFNEICAILHEREQQSQYVETQMTIRGGNDFPQGRSITIKIKDVRFTGVMSGETFTITQVYHPDLEEIDNPPCVDIAEAAAGWRMRANNSTPANTTDCNSGGHTATQDIVGGGGESWRYYGTFEKSRFIWLPPGTDVFLDDESDLVYVVSLIPGTVNQVAAYRTFGDTTLLVEVPTEYYEVHTVDYGGYEVVELRLPKALSSYPDSTWDDDIYVSFSSEVGPNPVDTIEWLVEQYTDLTIDTTSFASVKASLTNYPSNFYVKERMTVLSLIQDIAYQARCAVIVRNNTISLVYLSKEPTSVRTITESDIVVNSFQVTHTDTEDLVTRHQVNWRQTDAPVNQEDDPNLQFVLKHNIPKYGVIRGTKDYYTYNIFELALKSATFWMIRKANTWKFVEFETPLKHLDLEVFDCVTLDIDQFTTVKCVIVEANYDAEKNTIKFKCWTPILAGTESAYFWAWPALQDANAVFPLVDSDQSGDGYDFVVEPPEDHPIFRGGYDEDTQQVWTDGDRNPSDLDDTFPTVVCLVATGAEIAPDLEPVLTAYEPLADENFADRMDDVAAGSVSSDDEEEKTACGEPQTASGGFCVYEVTVHYITPDLVCTRESPEGIGCNNAGPCGRGQSEPGRPCTGAQHSMCHTFGALWGATLFKSQKDAEARALWDNCGYVSGRTDVFGTATLSTLPGDGAFGECEEAIDTSNPMGTDEITQPAVSA